MSGKWDLELSAELTQFGQTGIKEESGATLHKRIKSLSSLYFDNTFSDFVIILFSLLFHTGMF